MSKVVKYTATVFVLSLAARGLGFVRNIIFVNTVGVGIGSDAFFVAVAAVDFFILFFGLNAMKSVATTTFTQQKAEGKDAGSYLTALIGVVMALGLLLSLPLLLAPRLLTRLFAPGFSPPAADITAMCFRLAAFMVLFKGMLPILESLLGVERRFAAQNMFMPLVNVVTIAAIAVSPAALVLPRLCASFTIALGLACAGSYLCLAAGGIRMTAVSWDEARRHVRRFAALAFPLLFATTAYSLAEIADRMIASFFQKGVVTSMGVAHSLCFLTVFALLDPFSKVLFPHFSRLYFEKRFEQLERDFNLGQFLIALTFIPVSIFFIFFSRDMVAAMLVARKISAADISTASRMLGIYAVALIFNAGFFLPSYILQSAHKNACVGRISAVVFLGKVGCSILFAYTFGYIGIPLGTMAGFAANCVLLTAAVRRHLGIRLSPQLVAATTAAIAVSLAAAWIAGLVRLPAPWFSSMPPYAFPVASCLVRCAVYAAVAVPTLLRMFGRQVRDVMRMRTG